MNENDMAIIISLGMLYESTPNEIARRIIFELARSGIKVTESPSPTGAAADE